MDYKKLHYRKIKKSLLKALDLLAVGTEYIIVWNGDSITYFGFKVDVDVGEVVTYDNNTVIKSHVDWWELHPDTFPSWDIKEPE